MKRIIIFAVTLILLSAFALPCFAQIESKYIIDDADLLSDYEEQSLLENIKNLQKEYDCNIVIHTTPDTNGKDTDDYCDSYYDNGSYDENCIIFVISMAERDYYIGTYGTIADLLPDRNIDDICEDVVPCLSDEEYYSAFEIYLTNLDDYLANREGAEENTLSDYLIMELIIITGSVIIAFLIVNYFKKKMNTAVRQRDADNYVVNGSFNLTASRDMLISSNIVRRPIPKNNNGSGHSGGVKRGGSGGKF